MKLTETDLLKEVQQYLSYDSLSGLFTYTKQRGYSKAGDIAGTLHKTGYVYLSIKGKRVSAHRLAFLITYGRLPLEIDHINRVKSDNRLDNLREVTHSQNQHNQARSKANTTGVKGVSWNTFGKCYRASIRINKIEHRKYFKLSEYSSKQDALEAAQNWVVLKRIELHKEFANHE